MKFEAVTVRDAEGEKRLGRDQFPLRIGTGIDCHVRLPGPGNTAVALLDELDGSPFIQPTAGSSALTIDGEPLTTARKLESGSQLEFYGTRVAVEIDDSSIVLDVRLEGSEYITRPPEVAASGEGAEDEAIAPAAFRRAAETSAATIHHKSYRWQSAVGIAVALLAAMSWLLFTARSISFDVQPAGADTLDIAGGWFKMPLGDRVLMRPGSYVVNVSRQGYYDVRQALEIDETPSRTVVIEMRKLPGKVTVTTDPPTDAVVTVNDSEIGQAPFGPIELEPGMHSISVEAERYLPFADRLEVPGLGIHQSYVVQLVPQWANVQINSEPTGATVYAGERKLGTTPTTLELMEGKHKLTVIADGFAAWDGNVETAPNEDQALPLIRLEPANAQLRVNSIPRGANVTVNGRYRGQSPLTLDLSPEIDYQIGLSKAGYGSTVRRIRLAAAAAESITIDLAARVGKLTLNVLPQGATVYIDGSARGSGSMTLDLSSAPHQLEVRKDGYQTFARTVNPRPGYPQTISVRLLTEQEVAARSTANTLQTSAGQTLRRIEPGEFTMGTSRREQGRQANEVLVPVVISKPFFISEKPVSNREFLRFRKNHISGQGVHPALAGDLNPVVNVSWEDAVEYLNWLSTQEGLTPAYEKKFERWQPITPTPDGYRLPTEAEWVLAVRYQGRKKASVFPWGDRLPPRRESGNYADRSARDLVPSILPNYDDGYASTSPVGSFPANALGLYDTGGNVAEWVQDYYSVPNPGQTEAVADPQGPRRGNNRVIRGSSWRHAGVRELRLGYRDFGTSGRIDVGFRIAKNAD